MITQFFFSYQSTGYLDGDTLGVQSPSRDIYSVVVMTWTVPILLHQMNISTILGVARRQTVCRFKISNKLIALNNRRCYFCSLLFLMFCLLLCVSSTYSLYHIIFLNFTFIIPYISIPFYDIYCLSKRKRCGNDFGLKWPLISTFFLKYQKRQHFDYQMNRFQNI